MLNAGKDALFALRMLARNRGFTAVVIGTLALGIGANTAIFSLVDGVLLKSLPFRDADRLVMIWNKTSAVSELSISELDLNDYRARTHVFQEMGGFTSPGNRTAILTGAGNPVGVALSFTTQNYFSVLGLKPVIGRDFLPEEGRRGHDGVAILSYSLWKSRFGGSGDVVGRSIALDRESLQVVGVMGPEAYPAGVDVFVPFSRESEKSLPRNYHQLDVVGRMRPGQSMESAQGEMNVITADLARAFPATNSGMGSNVEPLRDQIIGKVREPILLLFAAVGLVLLIACANVANLLLVRAAARQKEIAIRVALGAGQGQIIGQFAIECLILSFTGAALGLLLAAGLMPLLRLLGAQRIPRLQDVAIDGRVLLYTVASAVVAGLIFGVIPALRFSSGNLNQVLRSGGRTSKADSGRLRNILVAGEVALALVVVVGAGLLGRSLSQLTAVNPGFRADHLLIAQIALPTTHYHEAEANSFYNRLLPKIAAIPGVTSVSTSTALPLTTVFPVTRFGVRGQPLPEPGRYPSAAFSSIDPEYFRTMGIPILRGRAFTRQEMGNADFKCIVNQTLARNFLAGQDPIGQTILINVAVTPPESCRIVGLVGDTRQAGLDVPIMPELYFASYVQQLNLMVRTSIDPLVTVPAIQREVAAVDPEQPVSEVRTMDEMVARSLSRRSFAAVLLGIFSAVGLLLAALGLYGVISYSVAQRTQEIGVRMALGAQQGAIFKMILAQGLMITGFGLIIGILAAAGTAHFMSSLLYGIGTIDPISYILGCVLLLAVAALASFIPAYRATRVDPLFALRYE